MRLDAQPAGRLRRWLSWLWPLGLLLIAWLIAPLRAGAAYPGMPCTAQADTVFSLASYTLLFIPTALVLLLISRRLIPRARRRGLRAWTAGFIALALAIAVVFLAFGGVSADRRPIRTGEHPVACPHLGAGLQALHCWQDGSTIEMNAYGQRPLNLAGIQAMGQALASVKQDAALYEAFVLDTTDPTAASYSNARLFVLTHSNLTDFADLCLSEHQATLASVQSLAAQTFSRDGAARAARQVFEETEEIHISLRRTHKVSVQSEEHGSVATAPVDPPASVSPGERQHMLTRREAEPELRGSDGPSQLPPAQ